MPEIIISLSEQEVNGLKKDYPRLSAEEAAAKRLREHLRPTPVFRVKRFFKGLLTD